MSMRRAVASAESAGKSAPTLVSQRLTRLRFTGSSQRYPRSRDMDYFSDRVAGRASPFIRADGLHPSAELLARGPGWVTNRVDSSPAKEDEQSTSLKADGM